MIDTPPPFTSGNLHIGRAYACILSDVVARYKRMRGFNMLLPQGWDTQGLPTELAVQNKLKISPNNIEEFRDACRRWTRQMIRQMQEAMRLLGYVPDWSFEYKTMDKEYHRKVQLALLNLHRKGRIYRSKHPVHWCPKCRTALADAELGYRSEETRLAYLKFKVESESVEIATTRPELLNACVAVAYHPKDMRFKHLSGKKAEVPVYSRKVPIIADESVDPEYGTGMVMICTFGDDQDVKTALKYGLETIEAIDEEGRIINSNKYDGLGVGEAREAILRELEENGVLSRIVKIQHNVLAHMERQTCQTPIEFLAKAQWFIYITNLKDEMKRLACKIDWVPKHSEKRLVDWIEGLGWDWLFSRQRRFGTPIPFWHCEKCGEIVAPREEDLPVDPSKQKPPIKECPNCHSKELLGAEDICDCWVDSSITPLVIAGWPEVTKRYPISLRQQGSEIIRTWAFYSLVQSYLQTGCSPFKSVLVNGMLLGPDGRAMSSSLGNTIEPLEVVEKYGADALRQGLLLASVGSDFPFEWKGIKYCYGFMQKLWNACRFAQSHLKDLKSSEKQPRLYFIDRGVMSMMRQLVDSVTERMETYSFHLALQELQSFVWHELCDYYIEMAKNRLCMPKESWMKSSAQHTLGTVLFTLSRLISPFTPHIAEEIGESLLGETVSKAEWPSSDRFLVDEEAEKAWSTLKEVVSGIWKLKSQSRLPLNAEIAEATVRCNEHVKETLDKLKGDIKEVGRIKRLRIVKDGECAGVEVSF